MCKIQARLSHERIGGLLHGRLGGSTRERIHSSWRRYASQLAARVPFQFLWSEVVHVPPAPAPFSPSPFALLSNSPTTTKKKKDLFLRATLGHLCVAAAPHSLIALVKAPPCVCLRVAQTYECLAGGACCCTESSAGTACVGPQECGPRLLRRCSACRGPL